MSTSAVSEIAVVVEKGRRYLWAKDVGAVIGMNEFYLDCHLRPDVWAAPRDFIWTGAAYLYAEESLPQLADSIHAAGCVDAALVLRQWITARLALVRAQLSEQSGLESGNQPGSHKPCDVGSNPTSASKPAKSRLLTWEDEHS